MKTITKLKIIVLAVAFVANSVNAKDQEKPNVIYFLVDNLGMGEISSYDGGLTRGVKTAISESRNDITFNSIGGKIIWFSLLFIVCETWYEFDREYQGLPPPRKSYQ